MFYKLNPKHRPLYPDRSALDTSRRAVNCIAPSLLKTGQKPTLVRVDE